MKSDILYWWGRFCWGMIPVTFWLITYTTYWQWEWESGSGISPHGQRIVVLMSYWCSQKLQCSPNTCDHGRKVSYTSFIYHKHGGHHSLHFIEPLGSLLLSLSPWAAPLLSLSPCAELKVSYNAAHRDIPSDTGLRLLMTSDCWKLTREFQFQRKDSVVSGWWSSTNLIPDLTNQVSGIHHTESSLF